MFKSSSKPFWSSVNTTSRPGKTHGQARTGNITSPEDAIPPCAELVNHITAALIEIAILLQ